MGLGLDRKSGHAPLLEVEDEGWMQRAVAVATDPDAAIAASRRIARSTPVNRPSPPDERTLSSLRGASGWRFW